MLAMLKVMLPSQHLLRNGRLASSVLLGVSMIQYKVNIKHTYARIPLLLPPLHDLVSLSNFLEGLAYKLVREIEFHLSYTQYKIYIRNIQYVIFSKFPFSYFTTLSDLTSNYSLTF
jgi:hypothetical protein